MTARGAEERDRSIARSIERWFAANARELPWRRLTPSGRRDAYASLVSEAMLQQTQVARVLERFESFLDRFPTIEALAESELDDVLGEWSGLGYYRRARMLHAAAREIVASHGGRVPESVEALGALPGIGRYTAGALASMVFGQRVPIVDGNVRRVLMRLEGREEGEAWTWRRAESLVEASREPGAFNEGLMELGATVCTPRGPRCDACPVAARCVARAEGRQGEIPAPREGRAKATLHQTSVVVRDTRGRTLVERRGESGLWAGLWQAPTLESEARAPGPAQIKRAIGLARARRVDRFVHETTHRRVEITVLEGCLGPGRRPLRGRWADRAEIGALGLSSPQRRILLGR